MVGTESTKRSCHRGGFGTFWPTHGRGDQIGEPQAKKVVERDRQRATISEVIGLAGAEVLIGDITHRATQENCVLKERGAWR